MVLQSFSHSSTPSRPPWWIFHGLALWPSHKSPNNPFHGIKQSDNQTALTRDFSPSPGSFKHGPLFGLPVQYFPLCGVYAALILPCREHRPTHYSMFQSRNSIKSHILLISICCCSFPGPLSTWTLVPSPLALELKCLGPVSPSLSKHSQSQTLVIPQANARKKRPTIPCLAPLVSSRN